MLEVIAEVFQKDPIWFLDDEPEQIDITPEKGNRGGISGMALEPSFCFPMIFYKSLFPRCSRKLGSLAANLLIS